MYYVKYNTRSISIYRNKKNSIEQQLLNREAQLEKELKDFEKSSKSWELILNPV